MKTVNFLGNPSSPHVRHWEMVLTANGMRPVVHGIASHLGEQTLVQTARKLGPGWAARLPATLAYAVAGIWLRLQAWLGRPVASFFHAHNTSGYGLTALLSGAPYVVTTYGTEIFEANKRSALYRYLIRSVLHKAEMITSTSPQMTETLIGKFGVDARKISEMSLGVSPVFQYSPQARKNRRAALDIQADATVWIVNRRMHSIYHTLEVVRAFNAYSANQENKHLILIEGDADPTYARAVERETTGNPRIHVIHGFLTQGQLCDWLCAADFAISVPKSDQLSSSILEAMQCDVIPVLGDLPSYRAIESVAEWVDLSPQMLQSNLELMFERTCQYSTEHLQSRRCAVREKIRAINSTAAITDYIHELYLKH